MKTELAPSLLSPVIEWAQANPFPAFSVAVVALWVASGWVSRNFL